MSVEKLRKYIIRQLAGDFRLSEDQRNIRMELRTLTPTIRKNIFSEGRLWGISDDEIEYTIHKVNISIGDCHTPRIRTLNYIDPCEVRTGLEVTLVGSHNELGIAELMLLSMGNGRFFVLKSDRNGLIPGDIVKVADRRKWGVDHCAFFRVDCGAIDTPDSSMVYRTFVITEIRLKEPSEIVEIADSNSNFTFKETRIAGLNENDKIPIAKNPMSLLLDNNAEDGTLDLNFNNGSFSFKSLNNVLYPPTTKRNTMFKFNSNTTLEKTVKLATHRPGKLLLDEMGYLVIEQQAEANVSVD